MQNALTVYKTCFIKFIIIILYYIILCYAFKMAKSFKKLQIFPNYYTLIYFLNRTNFSFKAIFFSVPKIWAYWIVICTWCKVFKYNDFEMCHSIALVKRYFFIHFTLPSCALRVSMQNIIYCKWANNIYTYYIFSNKWVACLY